MPDPMPTPDALYRLAQAKDPAAWAAVLERHGAEIHRICLRTLRDPALADDACQETLLLIRDRAGQFQGGANEQAAARGWILRIACTVALGMLRGREREQRREQVAGRDRARRQETTMPLTSERDEQAASVHREVLDLPEHERRPLMLLYFGQLGYEEIAASLDCPIGTAKARVHRGLERLRRRLAALGVILTLVQLDHLLGTREAHAAEAAGASGVDSSPEQLECWRTLLDTERKPTVSIPNDKHGGWTTMRTIGLGSAAAVALAVLLALALNANGADAAAHKPAEKQPAAPPAEPREENRKAEGEAAAGAPATAEERARLAEANTAFAFDLHAKLREKKGNLFFSPYSVSAALSMTLGGARGNTAKQMSDVLHTSGLGERAHAAFGALRSALETADGDKAAYTLAVANRLWGEKTYSFLDAFLKDTQRHYGASLEPLDFKKDPDGSRKTINAWVEQRTEGKVKDLLLPGTVIPATRLILTNAIYFKSAWKEAFDPKATQPMPYTTGSGKGINVPTMVLLQKRLGYYEEENRFQALELDYAGEQLSMVLLLPDENFGLGSLERECTPKNLQAWAAKLVKVETTVFLPRFKMTWHANLSDSLMKMGMTDAFDPTMADFSGMNKKKDFFIGFVVHKAFVDVNEEGTEAAAATAVGMDQGMGPRGPIFRANRPFVFLIRHKSTGSVLFMGRVDDPSAPAE